MFQAGRRHECGAASFQASGIGACDLALKELISPTMLDERHRRLKFYSRFEESFSTVCETRPVADIDVIGLFGEHLWIGG
jgi:hypothetical protein